MATPLRVLMAEDVASDAELNAHELRRAGFEVDWLRVDNEADFVAALERFRPDVVLCDHSIPGFGGSKALRVLRARAPELPVVVVTGSLDEETAVETLKGGAWDYVLKDRRARLGPAVARVLQEARQARQHRLAEARLEMTQFAIDNSEDMVLFVTETGRLAYANQSAVQRCGYSRREELLALSVWDLSKRVDEERWPAQWAALRLGGSRRLEDEVCRADGSTFPVEVVVTHVRLGVTEFQCAILRDISERRRAEERQAQSDEMLRQSQKLEAIGRLAGGVAHDLNNLLGVITGFGELATRQLPPEHPAQARLEQIGKAAARAADLTRQMLAFSRKQVLHPRRLNLNEVVESTRRMLSRMVGEDIDLTSRLDPGLGTVLADPTQIAQVLMNLSVNARDAMPDGGTLTFETANVELDAEYVRGHAMGRPGSYVMLAVTDTGIGMDRETQAHVFEPFFTTKPEGVGTGLGLATVYGIVKQSGGFIWVYSEPEHGATFKIYLPRVDQPADPLSPAAEVTAAPRGHETILLVEDQEALREMIQEVLVEHGYTVLAAANGAEAIAVARRHVGPLHLLLTDVVMPGMSGRELTERLLAERPGLCVLHMSGYTNGSIEARGLSPSGGVLRLEKPFASSKLMQAVRQALEGR